MTGSSAPKRHKAPLGIDAGGYIIDRMPATYMMDTDGAPLRQSKRWRGRDARIHVCKCSEYSLFPCCNVECTLLTTWPMAMVGSAAAALGTIFTIFFPLFSLEYFCED